MLLDDIINDIYPLPIGSLKKLQDIVTEVIYPKGYLLLEADKIERSLYFIKKGIARAYSNLKDTEITFWFGTEGETIISMRSYIEDKKGYENIELLEDCTLYEMNTNDLKQLFESDIHITNWGRKLAEKELIKTEERMINREFRTASDRYHELMLEQPQLLKRVQLGYIASYLGITQVSLSRIRAERR